MVITLSGLHRDLTAPLWPLKRSCDAAKANQIAQLILEATKQCWAGLSFNYPAPQNTERTLPLIWGFQELHAPFRVWFWFRSCRSLVAHS